MIYCNLGAILIALTIFSVSYENTVLTKVIAEIWEEKGARQKWSEAQTGCKQSKCLATFSKPLRMYCSS